MSANTCLSLLLTFDGASESALPGSDQLLRDRSHLRGKINSLSHGRRHPEFDFVDELDFLLYELYPSMRPSIRRYYQGGGAKIGNVYGQTELQELDRRMTEVLDLIDTLTVRDACKEVEWWMVRDYITSFVLS